MSGDLIASLTAGTLLIAFGVVLARWTLKLQDRLEDHAERIARLEGKTNTDPKEEKPPYSD